MIVKSVNRLVDIGLYSCVFDIQGSSLGKKTSTNYTLKRTFFYSPSAINCALRERHVFSRLLKEKVYTKLLPKLYHSSMLHGSVIFITNMFSGLKLSDLLREDQDVGVRAARFYVAEVMCALEKLHQLNIVHMNVKPKNILIHESGHVMLANFDRSIDLSVDNFVLSDSCFSGTLRYIAPEIMNKEEICTKADIWCLGMLMCSLVKNRARSTCEREELKEMAKRGDYSIEMHDRLSENVGAFIKLCLQQNCAERPDISTLKYCQLFSSINWEHAESCRMYPPILPSEVGRPDNLREIEQDPLILDLAFGQDIPRIDPIRIVTDELGKRSVEVVAVDQSKLDEAGCTVEYIAEVMSHYDLKSLSTSSSYSGSS